jgi:MFS family permease
MFVTVGGMLFGFDISSMSTIISPQQCIAFFYNHHGANQGAINSALAAGSVTGFLMAGPISDHIGHHASIMFASFWWLVRTAVQTTVNGFGSLMAGHILNGVCVGITSSQVPVYLAEITKKEKRGSIRTIQQLAIEWGILIVFFIGYARKHVPGPSSFRPAWDLQFVPCVVLIAGLPFFA